MIYSAILCCFVSLSIAQIRTPEEIRAIRVTDQANTRRLYRDLMKGYNKFLSPLPQNGYFARENDDEQQREPFFTVACDQIILVNVYESSGVFSIIMAVNFTYTDERLSWQPEYYNNIPQIYMGRPLDSPIDSHLVPVIHISCQSFTRPQFDDMNHAEVSFDGTVEMALVWQLSCNCTIDRCISFFSFLDGSNDRVVTLTTTGYAVSNDVWYTSNISVGEESWKGARGEQEKIGLGIGSLTSIMFILSSMTQSIPKKNVPVLALFVMFEMLIIVVGIIYLALDPSRLILLVIPEEERNSGKWRKEGKRSLLTRVLLLIDNHLHHLFLLILLTGSACNLGFNILRYYKNE